MCGRHEQPTGAGARLRWFGGALGLGLLTTVLLSVSSASAAAQTVNAQLSLSGVATSSSPTGGSVVGIHPGDGVTFKASTLPTAGLDKLGLGGLVGGLLDSGASYQVTVDFSRLPGGAKNTVLSGTKTVHFAFAHTGTYQFTWTAQSVTVVSVLGTQVKHVNQIQLDGNQLRSKGISVNASNQYVGEVVVAANPPAGGISIQLPGVSIAPRLPVVGQLPRVGVPGVRLPTVPVSVPNLIPSTGKTSSGGSTHKTHKPTSPSTGVNYTPPSLTVPDRVVPHGIGPQVGGGGGAFDAGSVPQSGVQNVNGNLASGNGGSTNSGASGNPAQAVPAGKKVIDLASTAPPSGSGQLPVLLAIIAIIALALVAGVYARLYLTRHPAASPEA